MPRYRFNDLIRIMARLRGPHGCPWDRDQTHQSLLKYLKAESAEVAQAVRRRDHDNLCEELGDLLLQIVFHAQLAHEKKRFTVHRVIDGICRKLVRRHPHVFGGKKLSTAQEVVLQWDELKRREKSSRRHKKTDR